MNKRQKKRQAGRVHFGLLFIKTNIFILTLFLVVIFTIATCLGIFYHATSWERLNDDDTLMCINYNDATYKSDVQINENEEFFILSGYSYKLNERVNSFGISIALKPENGQYYIIVPTHMVKRNDISINEGVPKKRGLYAMYDASGFETKIIKNRLERNKQYKLYILNNNNGENVLIDIGRTICYE